MNLIVNRLLTDHFGKVLGLVVFVGLFFNAYVTGTLGQIGADSDDLIRLIQVRDFFAGQSWFDVHQYRLGTDGTLMHWTRIPDIPLIVLTAFFDIFLPFSQAEIMAFSLWPVLCAMLVITGMTMAGRHLPDRMSLYVVGVLTFVYIIDHSRFLPGSIDHHNLQLGLLALALGGLLDPAFRARSFILAGVALGLTFTIGMEIYVFSAVLCAAAACLWAYHGENARQSVRYFAIAFSATLTIVFFGTIAPENYGVVHCDTYSNIVFKVGLIAGLGLAIATLVVDGTILKRLAALALLAGVCLFVIATAAPQCLSNPLASLPDDARHLWLDSIQEAKPIWNIPHPPLIIVPYMMGVQCVAVGLCVMRLFDRKDMSANILFLALLLSTICLTIYQARFLPFGFMFSMLPLAQWIGRCYVRATQRGQVRTGAIGALAASMPFVWAVPYGVIDTRLSAGKALEEPYEITDNLVLTGCYGPTVTKALNDLPTGLVVANPNGAPRILSETRHRVLTGNYHRNPQGIVDGIRIFTRAPSQAHDILLATKVDYLVFCYPTNFIKNLSIEYPKGMAKALIDGHVPDFLTLAANPTITDEGRTETVSIYRVTEK